MAASDSIKIWDPQLGGLRRGCKGHDVGARWALSSHDGLWVASESLMEKLEYGSRNYAPDTARLELSSLNKTINIWDLKIGKCLPTLLGYEDQVIAAAWRQHSAWMVLRSEDRAVIIWNV